jgi:hypothetical protein
MEDLSWSGGSGFCSSVLSWVLSGVFVLGVPPDVRGGMGLAEGMRGGVAHARAREGSTYPEAVDGGVGVHPDEGGRRLGLGAR